MKKRILSFVLALCLVFALVPAVPAAVAVVSNMPIAQANGFIAPIDNVVPANAIRVSTAAELAAIGGTQSAGNYYVLTNNINLTAEWVPIDNFHGTFDGQGFTINNLFVLSSSNRQYAGLFAQASEHATIKNVGVNIGLLGVYANRDRSAAAYAGGLIGKNNGATVANSYVIGTVSASSTGRGLYNSFPYAGGLIGNSNGAIISNCYTSGTASVSIDYGAFVFPYVGGLIGNSANDTITSSYATGSVSASSSRPNATNVSIGGLIGRSNGSVITYSYATGAISASSIANRAGGLIGLLNDTAIINCYAAGRISATSSRFYTEQVGAGGLVGYISGGIVVITNSYATGVVTAEGGYAFVGGLIANRNANSHTTVTNSYYSSQIIIGDSTWSVGTFIAEWAVRGVISAVDKSFVPEEIQGDFESPITRGEFARLAMNYLKVTLNMTAAQLEAAYTTNSVISFTDTSDPDLQAAGRIGITSGVSGEPDARQFGANILFDREQAAFMLRRVHMIINSGPETVPDQGYNDMDEAQWHPGAINYVIHHGIMQGTEPARGIFSPKRHFTREQSIITFDRMG